MAGHAGGGVERLEDVPAAADQATHVAGGVDHLGRPDLGDGPDAGGGVEAYPPVGIEVVKKVAIARDAASGGGRSGGAGLLGYLVYLYFLPLPFAGIRSLVVRWMLARRLAGHSAARITRARNDAGVPCPSAADPARTRTALFRAGTSTGVMLRVGPGQRCHRT